MGGPCPGLSFATFPMRGRNEQTGMSGVVLTIADHHLAVRLSRHFFLAGDAGWGSFGGEPAATVNADRQREGAIPVATDVGAPV